MEARRARKDRPATELAPSRFRPLAHALVITAGRAGLQRALPMYLGVAIAAAVVFEGNGMRPATLTRLAATNPAFRIGLWCVWLLVSLPVVRAVLGTPSTFFLRALPIPRWRFFVVQGALLAVAELPWAALWTRGAGPVAGIAATLLALAAHGFIVVWPARASEIGAALGVGVVIAAGAPPWLLGLVAAVAVPISLRGAWLRAPERGRTRDAPMLFGPAPIALGLAYAVTLYRSQGALLVRAVFFVLVAAVVVRFVATNERVTDANALSALSLTLFAPAVTLAGASLASPVLRTEREARWLLDVCRTSSLVRASASMGAVLAPCVALGTIYGVLVGSLTHAAWTIGARLALEAAVAGGSLGVVAMAAVHWAARGDGRDAARVVLAVLVSIVAAVALVRAVLVWAIVLFSATAAAAFARRVWSSEGTRAGARGSAS